METWLAMQGEGLFGFENSVFFLLEGTLAGEIEVARRKKTT